MMQGVGRVMMMISEQAEHGSGQRESEPWRSRHTFTYESRLGVYRASERCRAELGRGGGRIRLE